MTDKTRKRLHVGGLSSSVTETDLTERLGKFGDINSVDIKVKKDESGQPFKTFAYIDISITEKSLQHCIRVYNNTKWKGGTLEIQLAKENFLDRLRKEQISKQNVEAPKTSAKDTMKPRDKNSSDFSASRYNNDGNVENSLEKPVAMRPRKKDGKFIAAGQQNITKYADEADTTDRSVSNLTWSLENSSATDVRDTPKIHHMTSQSKHKVQKSFNAEKPQLVKPMQSENRNSAKRGNSNRTKENSKRARILDQTSDRYSNFTADLVDVATTSTPQVGTKTSNDKVENISSVFLKQGNTGDTEDGYESADSACTDEIISNSRKNPPKRQDNSDVYNNFFGEYSEGVESYRGEGYWSDEDVFDLLESGKVSELRKMQDCAEKKNRSKLKPAPVEPPERDTNKSVKTTTPSRVHTAVESEADKKNTFGSVLEKLWSEKPNSKSQGKSSMPDADQNISNNTSSQSAVNRSRDNLSKGDLIDSERKKEKHNLSNLKRLESLKQRQKETTAQKLALQQALASVDKQSSNKKIVFDSDSEEERCKESVESTKEKLDNAELDTKHGKSSSKKSGIRNIQAEDSKKKPSLFDSSDESEDESDVDDEAFRHRPQFEGAAGSKLFRLQAKFGNDQRFKMDERFIDEDDDMENDRETDFRQEAQNDPEESEKLKAMEILKDVLGSKGILDRKQSRKKTFRDINDLHYDPSRQDHRQFEIEEKKQPVKKQKIQKADTEEVERKEEPLPEVSKERFFEVATSLKSAFKKQENEPFSLLSTFGSVEEEAPAKSSNAEAVPVPIKKNTTFGWQDDVDSDSSEEEGQMSEKLQKPEGTSSERKSNVIVFPAEKETFFFTENDQRIKEGIDFFHRTEDTAVIREKWLEERPHLIDAYRMKHKRMLRTRKSLNKQAKRGRRT